MLQFYSDNNRDLLASIHKLNCILDSLENFNDEDVIMEYVIEKQQRDDFHLLRGMRESSCATLVCRICGSDKLIVGQEKFFTAVKCDECGYELAVHEG